ncbi:hypothetical protein [Phenylobacterium conjunctum]|uniref:Uncharacterized protein n=1 Tax=Phenylobacterium conjunctum TaxID=1298959 RepID=A0ABW3SVZ0_9CAUL
MLRILRSWATVFMLALLGAGSAGAQTTENAPDILLRRAPTRGVEPCAQAAGVFLQQAGFRVWRMDAATVSAGKPGGVGSALSVICGATGADLVLRGDWAFGGEAYARADRLLKDLTAALATAPPAQAPAWAPGSPFQSFTVRHLPLDRKVRCRVIAEQATRGMAFKAVGLRGGKQADSYPTVPERAPWFNFNCERDGELTIVMGANPQDAYDPAPYLARVLTAAPLAVGVAEAPPHLDVALTAHGDGGAGRCMAAAKAVMLFEGMSPKELSDDSLFANKMNGSLAVRCTPEWALAAAAGSGEVGTGDFTNYLPAAYASPPKAIAPDALPADTVRPALGTVHRPNATTAADCAEAATLSLKAAGYTAEPSAETYGDAPKAQIIKAALDTAPAAATLVCTATRYAIVAAFGRNSPPATAEMTRLDGLMAEELTRPHWGSRGPSGLSYEAPRAGDLTLSTGPDGERATQRASFDGVEYVGWVLRPPSAGPVDPQALLARQTAALEAEGATVAHVEQTSFKRAPSLAVWASRPGPDGRSLKIVARYVVHQNALYGIEFRYPEGRNPAAELQRFSESLQIYGLY